MGGIVMNENIDLTKILDGCPVGIKLYSTLQGEVDFVRINFYNARPIVLSVYNEHVGTTIYECYAKDGRYNSFYDGECTLFPSKEQRDWSKFERFWDKPKVKKFDINTFQPFDKVLVRNRICDYWNAFPFSHMFKRRAICCDFSWEQCIPYNEETKNLVGKKDDCPEYYKWWEE